MRIQLWVLTLFCLGVIYTSSVHGQENKQENENSDGKKGGKRNGRKERKSK